MSETDKSLTFLQWRPKDKGDSVAWALILIWGALIILGGYLELGDKYLWWNPW